MNEYYTHLNYLKIIIFEHISNDNGYICIYEYLNIMIIDF